MILMLDLGMGWTLNMTYWASNPPRGRAETSSLITGYEDTEGYSTTSSVQIRWQELKTFNATDTEVNIPNSGIRLTHLNVLPQEELEKEYHL